MYLQICVPTKGVLIVKSIAISTCQSGILESNGVARVSDKKKRNTEKRISDFDPGYGFKMHDQQCLIIGTEQHICIIIGNC